MKSPHILHTRFHLKVSSQKSIYCFLGSNSGIKNQKINRLQCENTPYNDQHNKTGLYSEYSAASDLLHWLLVFIPPAKRAVLRVRSVRRAARSGLLFLPGAVGVFRRLSCVMHSLLFWLQWDPRMHIKESPLNVCICLCPLLSFN